MRVLSPYEKNQLLKHGFSQEELLKRGELPVEYLTEIVPFCGLELKVTPDTLIPRIETEGLVEHVATLLLRNQEAYSKTSPLTFADVGTGCGAIALAIAQKLERQKLPFSLYASDVSEKALTVAKENARQVLSPKTLKKITFLNSNLLKNYPSTLRFHALIANLPYIPTSRIATLEESVKSFEPWIALDGGEEGLSLILQFLEQAKQYLLPGGWVFLEVDYTHTKAVFDAYAPNWKAETFIDEALRQRFALLTLD